MDRSVKNFLYYVFFFGVITYIFKLAIGFFQLTTLLPLSLEISTSERWLLATTLSLATLLLMLTLVYYLAGKNGDTWTVFLMVISTPIAWGVVINLSRLFLNYSYQSVWTWLITNIILAIFAIFLGFIPAIIVAVLTFYLTSKPDSKTAKIDFMIIGEDEAVNYLLKALDQIDMRGSEQLHNPSVRAIQKIANNRGFMAIVVIDSTGVNADNVRVYSEFGKVYWITREKVAEMPESVTRLVPAHWSDIASNLKKREEIE